MNFFDKMNQASKPIRDKVARLAAAQAEHRKNMGNHARTFEIKTPSGWYNQTLTLQDLHVMCQIFSVCITALATHSEQFICHAIDNQVKFGLTTKAEAIKAKNYVMASIHGATHPHFTFNGWVREHYQNRSWNEEDNRTFLRTTRLTWLERTLARFEEILKEEHYPF